MFISSYKNFLIEKIEDRNLEELSVDDLSSILFDSIYNFYIAQITHPHIKKFVTTIIDYFGKEAVDFPHDFSVSKEEFLSHIFKPAPERKVEYFFQLENMFDIQLYKDTPLDFYFEVCRTPLKFFLDSTIETQKKFIILIDWLLKSSDPLSPENLFCFTQNLLNLMLKFDKLRVTNENGNHIDIYDVFVQIPINIELSNFSFRVNRSTYTAAQLSSGYMHSHFPSITPSNFLEFRQGCYGESETPIVKAIQHLRGLFYVFPSGPDGNITEDDVEIATNVFCVELVRFLETESIAGVPYVYLSQVTNSDGQYQDNFAYSTVGNLSMPYYKIFFDYFKKHCKLDFAYVNGAYTLGTSFIDYMIHLTEIMIDFINNKVEFISDLEDIAYNIAPYRNLLHFGTITADNRLCYYKNHTPQNVLTWKQLEGTYLFDFKGQPIKLNIIEDSLSQIPSTYLIDYTFAMYHLHYILNILNTVYDPNNIKEGFPSYTQKHKVLL